MAAAYPEFAMVFHGSLSRPVVVGPRIEASKPALGGIWGVLPAEVQSALPKSFPMAVIEGQCMMLAPTG